MNCGNMHIIVLCVANISHLKLCHTCQLGLYVMYSWEKLDSTLCIDAGWHFGPSFLGQDWIVEHRVISSKSRYDDDVKDFYIQKIKVLTHDFKFVGETGGLIISRGSLRLEACILD